jgi:hypothetical protein
MLAADRPFVESDALFRVKKCLIVVSEECSAGIAADGHTTITPYRRLNYDFDPELNTS